MLEDTTVHGYSIRSPIQQSACWKKSQGDMFVAIKIATGDKYTAKYYVSGDPSSKPAWELERGVLGSLKHENIQFAAAIENDKALYMITPDPSGGNLSQHTYYEWAQNEKSQAIYQIIDAIQFLHKNNVAHLDIQPSNFLIFKLKPVLLRIHNFCNTSNKNFIARPGITSPFTAPKTRTSENRSYICQRADL
ncbi:hypothetical protein TWF718_009697 [Orbilia javanica]|uniref:Protein kinase domain-containing protein n=1 Tax=Orbilia javanica TaxID=47235 RepID=A0AAN8RFW8_9PEZI